MHLIGTRCASNIGHDSFSVAGISNYEFGISQPSAPLDFLAINSAGTTGLLDLNDAALTPGSCVQSAANGHLVSTGSACGSPGGGFPPVQQLHGHQSITAVAAACTPGTPIVFGTTFSAVPDIIMSTSAVVGDTAAPETGTITTTGFTPELCSVASAATATVYWQAVN